MKYKVNIINDIAVIELDIVFVNNLDVTIETEVLIHFVNNTFLLTFLY